MKERVAAKAIIECEENKNLFVAGQRGMWNLVGGGLEARENERTALLREGSEEIENFRAYISTDELDDAFRISGITTSKNAVSQRTHWFVFQSQLLVPYSGLRIPPGSEITAIGVFSPQECIGHPNMSDMAKLAITKCYGLVL